MPIAQPNPRFFGYSQFGQGTPKNVEVGTSSTLLLALNLNRLYAQINNNGAKTIWVQLGSVAQLNRGRRLTPGTSLMFTMNELYLGAIYAISESGVVNTEVVEGV